MKCITHKQSIEAIFQIESVADKLARTDREIADFQHLDTV